MLAWPSCQALSVPQRWFQHFYWVASFWNVCWLGCLFASGGKHGVTFQSIAAAMLLQAHFVRRAYESTCVATYSPHAHMHVVGYLVGLRWDVATHLPQLLAKT